MVRVKVEKGVPTIVYEEFELVIVVLRFSELRDLFLDTEKMESILASFLIGGVFKRECSRRSNCSTAEIEISIWSRAEVIFSESFSEPTTIIFPGAAAPLRSNGGPHFAAIKLADLGILFEEAPVIQQQCNLEAARIAGVSVSPATVQLGNSYTVITGGYASFVPATLP